jgi:hypothetical protein
MKKNDKASGLSHDPSAHGGLCKNLPLCDWLYVLEFPRADGSGNDCALFGYRARNRRPFAGEVEIIRSF